MKKMVIELRCAGVLAFFFLLAAPASLFAEEYSLDDLCRIALTRSEKLKVAEENLTIAEMGKDKAFSYLLPRLTATAATPSIRKRNSPRRERHPAGERPPPGGSGWTRPSP